MSCAADATVAPVEERSVEILRDLLAGALADYWSGEDREDEASLTRTGPRTPPR